MEIPGKSMHIYLQPNAVPNSISIARLVPLRIATRSKSSHLRLTKEASNNQG